MKEFVIHEENQAFPAVVFRELGKQREESGLSCNVTRPQPLDLSATVSGIGFINST